MSKVPDDEVGALVSATVERLALFKEIGEDYEYELRIWFYRVEVAEWVVSCPNAAITLKDLSEEEVNPFRGTPMHGVLVGVLLAAGAASPGGGWIRADTVHPQIGQEVIVAELREFPGDTRREENAGLRANSFILKQVSLMREESDADSKRRGNGGGVCCRDDNSNKHKKEEGGE